MHNYVKTQVIKTSQYKKPTKIQKQKKFYKDYAVVNHTFRGLYKISMHTLPNIIDAIVNTTCILDNANTNQKIKFKQVSN